MFNTRCTVKKVLGFLVFVPLTLTAATATLDIPIATQQIIQQEVAAGQSGIETNIATAEAERAQQAQANAGMQTPGNAKPPVNVPVAPPVKAVTPPKPEVTDSTQAAEANAVRLEEQNNSDSDNYPQTPTGFISSGESNDDNSSIEWDYGF